MHTASLMHTFEPPKVLTAEDMPSLPPLTLEWSAATNRGSVGSSDGHLLVRYGAQTQTFVVEYKRDWTRRTLDMALEQVARSIGPMSAELPLVVLPYLDEEKLNVLEEKGVSGIDLCGNAVIIVPEHWFLRFTGRPNRFRSSQKLKAPYRGKASLVGRTLLKQPVFATAADMIREIETRGGNLSQGLVSRALSVLAEDLVIGERPKERIVLLQPDRLCDRLAQAWQIPTPRVLWRGRVAATTREFLPQLFENAARTGTPAVVTGLGSASRYANITTEDVVYIYANQAGSSLVAKNDSSRSVFGVRLFDSLLYADGTEPLLEGLNARPGERFANLELHLPPDDLVFYDLEADEHGVLWASDVQTYLEMAGADARMREAAEGLRARLIARAEKELRKVI